MLNLRWAFFLPTLIDTFMKKYIIAWLLLALTGSPLHAQQDCVFPMMVLVPNQVDSLSPMAKNKLESRLRQIVTQNNMEGGAQFSNFSIVANVVEGSKEVISGSRPLVTLTAELELFVGNNYTGEKFASTSIPLSGAGNNPARAYASAFAGISPTNVQLKQFVQDARAKVNEYYNTQLANILQQAKTYALRHEFEEALCLLSSVPTCSNNYDQVEACMQEVLDQYLLVDCAVKLNKARAIWNATQNREGAALAGAYLVTIDPLSGCWDEVVELAEQIRLRIGDDWEFSKELQREAVNIEKARIEAMRAIGIAFGENQKAKTFNDHWIVR